MRESRSNQRGTSQVAYEMSEEPATPHSARKPVMIRELGADIYLDTHERVS